jgi:hypothetical protein
MKRAAAHLGVCVVLAAISCGEPPPSAAWCEQGTGGCKVGYRCDDGRGPTRGQCVPSLMLDGGAGGVGGRGGVSGSGGTIEGDDGGASGAPAGGGGSNGADSGRQDTVGNGGADTGLSPDLVTSQDSGATVDTGLVIPPKPDGPVCATMCTPGATDCTGGGVATCVMLSNGCTDWGPPATCPAPQTCPTGKKQCACPLGACTKLGATQCSQGGLQTCGQDGVCLSWGSPTGCPTPQTCPAGKTSCECPSTSCSKEGSEQCGGGGIQTCTKMGACSSWTTTKSCAGPTTCQPSGPGQPLDCVCGAGNFSCPSRCQAPAGACVAIWFATPDGNGPPADCVHRSEGICRENECDLSIQKKRYIQPPDNLDALQSNCQTGGHFDELFAAVCAEIRARPSTPLPAYVNFFVDIYDSAGAWKANRWLTNKPCP